jgi:hypothetical protein
MVSRNARQVCSDRLGAWSMPGQRGHDRPVGPGQPRGRDLALEHGHLVAQGKDRPRSPAAEHQVNGSDDIIGTYRNGD